MAKINGGYYIKARIIQESEIAQSPPHFREIWDWLLKEANHKDKKVAGKTIERGQCLRSYKDILDGLKWKVGYRTERYSRGQCESSMKFLRSRGMITTTKTTRGMIITICNYSYYQEPKNYENHNEACNETDSSTQSHDTINKNDKNDKNKDIVNCPHEKIIDLYHEILPGLPKVIKWTEKRKAVLRARWNSGDTTSDGTPINDLKFWKGYFEYIATKKFLHGDNDRGWTANLEWIITERNYIKIREGGYN